MCEIGRHLGQQSWLEFNFMKLKDDLYVWEELTLFAVPRMVSPFQPGPKYISKLYSTAHLTAHVIEILPPCQLLFLCQTEMSKDI